MNLIIGAIVVVVGFLLNQWISHSLSKDALSRPMFLNYPTGILISTVLYISVYIVGLYFLYKVSIWIPVILVTLFLLLIVSNLFKKAK